MRQEAVGIVTLAFCLVLVVAAAAGSAYVHNDWRCAFTQCRIVMESDR